MFYDSKQPQNHMKEKEKGSEVKAEKETETPHAHNFYIAYIGDERHKTTR